MPPSSPRRAQGADPEDPDEYRAQGIFWVPPEARWPHLKAQARQSTIGQIVDDAMAGIERDNPALKGVLPKDYARPALDKQRLGQLIDMISNIQVGDEASRAKDVLGRVYEYFLSQFASAEGKKGGEFYTPRCVVKLLVEMLEPYHGRVYDPCCGSSGMFVQSVEFIRAHASGNGNGGSVKGGKAAPAAKPGARPDISIYGQESNYTTWRLARMNLAIRGIDSGQIAQGDTFHNDRHPDLKADFILANPPFNISDWGGERLQGRQALAVRHAAGGQRELRLGPAHRAPPRAGGRRRVRPRERVDVVESVGGGGDPEEPDRGRPRRLHGRAAGAALLLDADPGVSLVPRAGPEEREVSGSARAGALHRCAQARADGGSDAQELTDEDVARIAATYHAWRGEEGAGEYADVAGYCKSASLEEVRKHGHVLTPGRYVGAEAVEDDGEPFEEKMKRLVATLREQQAEAAKLDAAIAANLRELGYGE